MRRTMLSGIFWLGWTVAAICGCKNGGGSVDDTALTAPTGNSLSGVWTGTISRAGGAPPIELRMEATQNDQRFFGPMTLTLGNVTLRGNVEANMGGSPVQLFFPIDLRDTAALPNCTVRSGGSNVANPVFAGVERNTRSMTSSPTTMQYFNCQGFVEPDLPANFRAETGVQVTLTKQ
jgi:hypothetical protein